MNHENNLFNGQQLYGDDFDIDQLKQWYEQESEAYADMYGNNVNNVNVYTAHNLNRLYGYQYINHVPSLTKVLGFGSSWGYEFLPIVDKIKELYIIEPSTQTRSEELDGIKPYYFQPELSGQVCFENDSFDLVTCFSALHHVANVTYVMSELFRVLKPGGYMLLREPVQSMGDWRKPRVGLTKNERGIPANYLEDIIKTASVEVVQKHYFYTMNSFLKRIIGDKNIFTTKKYLYFDKYLSKMLSFNIHYHPRNKWERCAPQAVFYVLRKKSHENVK